MSFIIRHESYMCQLECDNLVAKNGIQNVAAQMPWRIVWWRFVAR
ncbi:8751_t:CDS:2, partial [Cetraspora pellucida]